jgi:hypothetical protein
MIYHDLYTTREGDKLIRWVFTFTLKSRQDGGTMSPKIVTFVDAWQEY